MPMPTREELDPQVTFRDQLEAAGDGPVILINTFTVAPEEAGAMLDTWTADSAVMRRQPGFIRAQLHRGVAGSSVFVNYAVWESAAHLKAAASTPEFLAAIARTPGSAVARPHLFEKVAVPGVCVAI